MAAKVLVAHGNTQHLRRAVKDLQQAGFEVVATPDGGDAFARFFEEEPNVVVCNVALPSLSGPNFARMVVSQSPGTGVVLLTDGSDASVAEDLEGIIVLQDPLDVAALRQAFPHLEVVAPSEASSQAQPDQTANVFVAAALKRFQRDNSLLALFDDAGIAFMATIAERQVRGANELVIKQGEPGDGFYLVVEGQVRVTLEEKDNQEVARIHPGGFFGEMAILSNQPRSASVWTTGPTTLLWFARDSFLPLLADYPTIREVLSGVALKRTEENLWRVLFDDDDVQNSIEQLHGPIDMEDVGGTAGDTLGAGEDVDVSFSDDDTALDIDVQGLQKSRGIDRTRPTPPPRLTQSHPRQQRRSAAFATGLALGVALGVGLGITLAGPDGGAILQPLRGVLLPSWPFARLEMLASETDSNELVPNNGTPKMPAVQPSEETAAGSTEGTEPAAGYAEHAASPASAKEAKTPEEVAERRALRKALFSALKAGQHQEARRIGNQLRSTFIVDWEAHFRIAEAERLVGDAKDALETYRTFFTVYPDNAFADDARYWAGELLLQLGQTNEGRTLLELVVADQQSDFRDKAAERLATLRP